MELLSVAEVAKRKGVDPRIVRYWCERHHLPNARKIGRDWVIPASDVDALKELKPGPAPGSKRKGSESA